MNKLSDNDMLWNRFIFEICSRKNTTLSPIQKNAVISFWYDAEMNSGGHSGFFDCKTNISKEELIYSLNAICAHPYEENFLEAVCNGEKDEHIKTDHIFFILILVLPIFRKVCSC